MRLISCFFPIDNPNANQLKAVFILQCFVYSLTFLNCTWIVSIKTYLWVHLCAVSTQYMKCVT